MLPQVNATLTTVRATGTADDYDYSGVDGVEKWTGRQGIYISERTERVVAGDATSVIVSRTAVVSADLGATVVQGDTLIYTRSDGTTVEAVAKAVALRSIPGVSGTVRVALEDA